MNRFHILSAAAAFGACLTAFAQTSLLPEVCIGKTGDALDKCVRDITPVQITPRVEAVEPSYDPAQMVNCLKINPADRNFCIRRNEVILECRNAFKFPDFGQCFSTYIVRAEKPAQVNCQREKPELRPNCTARNALVTTCSADPLRYFLCIGTK